MVRSSPDFNYPITYAQGNLDQRQKGHSLSLSLTVILPVYNEEKCISKTWDEIVNFSHNHPHYHFIIVNDGSTDNTGNILAQKMMEVNPAKITVISYPIRGGKGHAIKKAVELIESDYLCFMDGDLAYSLEHLHLLSQQLSFYEMVIGCRNLEPSNMRNLSQIRKLFGKIFNWLTRKILNLKYQDMQAGLKGFRKEVAQHLFDRQTISGFSFDAELIYIAKKKRYSIGEIPAKVSHHHITKASKVKLIQDSIKMFSSLLKIRYNDWLGEYD